MTYSKMPLKGNSKWPKQFGFEIVGRGPCFVLAVEKGSVAYNSGLQPGDQILELDNQDVMNMSAEALRTLARHSRTQPPTLGVVSRLLHSDVVGSKSMGLGMTVNDGRPVNVKSIEDSGPAQAAGLRPGDIILEVNSKPIYTSSDIKPHLSSHSRRVSVSFIPVGKQMTPSGKKNNEKVVTEGSRVKRAKDLHDKMNEILGDDYEKKMAIVGVLKQYAEDRDIEMLGRALAVILKTAHQRKLVRQIRPFIPPRQRARFDDITKQQLQQQPVTKEAKSEKDSNGTLSSAHKLGQRKALQIVRENGSFGFVIKGSNPAYIETVDPKGPAERAGLVPGDFVTKLNGIDVRKSSHAHLVHLLQDSGTAPIIEILRCNDNEYPYRHSGAGSASSMSSASSHTDSDWMTADHSLILDKEDRSYPERSEYLLTKRERSHIRKALLEYDSTSNIVELYESINQILDTPSKKTLWMFIMARLSLHHQQYCINQINLPRHVLLECLEKQGTSKVTSWGADGECVPLASPESSSLESPSTQHNEKSRIKIQSFQQQVEYLLTSRERSMLKKALQLYSDNRNAENLVEDLEVLLDTPSKRTLWMYIIPLLSPGHQDIVQQQVGFQSGKVSPRKTNTISGLPYLSSEDDEHDLFSKSGARKMKSKPGSTIIKGMDLTLIKELEETRKAVQEARQVFREVREKEELDRDITRYITVIPIDSQTREPALHSPLSIQVSNHPYQHTGLPHNVGGASPSVSGYATPIGNFSPPSTMRPRTYSNTSNSSRPGTRLGHHHQQQHQHHSGFDPRTKMTGNVYNTGLDGNYQSGANLMVSKFAKMGGDTFNRHALTALKQLDAAVAAEVSDLENNTDQSSGTDDRSSPTKNGMSNIMVPPPMAPPPPVPPPPPPVAPGVSQEQKNQMNVKRINWEKLDQGTVENTVWQQVGETEDLQDIVKYLELEQYFATKNPRQTLDEDYTDVEQETICPCVQQHQLTQEPPKPSDKRSEVCILNPKKSYNISILLGHLKLSLAEVKQALYLMDEEILTHELLRQLLAYAPSRDEMEKLDSYDGDLEELSQPDRFTYEMSRVPGYEQRLKALVFKGNFQEKIDEMKEHLNYIRKASLELRNSKKLSKILELILAMGNYMNQGNQRVGEAAGFKIKFLAQLEITKTADNKLTFLHVLAEAVYTKFPELIAVSEELTTVPQASKFSNVLLNQELQELRKVLQDISNTLERFGQQKSSVGTNDNFQDVMGHFISHASDEIQSLFRLNANTMEEFHTTVQYFGEDPKKVTTTELFEVFSEFVTKFEKAHRHNITYNRYS